jgi:hypothetical protein
MTKKLIPATKHDPIVIKHLKKTNSYLRGHFWKEDEVSLKDIGLLVTYVPTKHSKEFGIQDIHQRCAQTPTLNDPMLQLSS